jgi:protein HIRA/HIR1
VKRLEAHQGFVKGVSWDPVGKYLTSQADDRSVIFWNTFDWTVAKQVHEGFEKSGGQTFYKRHSWAPDGSQVCFVHAVDESRFQNVALIVDRETLSDSVSLVGSRSLVECSAYNPKLFASLSTSSAMNGDREGGHDDMITDESVQHYCLCAIGSQEGTLSLWQQNNPRASLVLENAFHGPIYDMTWSPDGLCLAACSGDSTITLLLIEQQKLSVGPRQLSLTAFGALLDTKRTEAALMRYGFQPGLKKALKNKADLIESASLLDLINEERARNVDVGGEGDMDIDLNKDGDVEARSGDGFRVDRDTHQKLKDRMGGSQGGEGFSQPLLSVPGSTAVVGADGKKRVQPILLSSISSSPLSQTQTVTTTKDGRRRVQPISLIPATPSPSKSILASSSLSQHQNQHLQSQQGTVEDYRIPPKPLALPMAKLKQSQSLDFSPHGKVIIENPGLYLLVYDYVRTTLIHLINHL